MFFLACLALAALPSNQAAAAGLVVERTHRGYAGERAGLKTGDVLLGWRRETPAEEPGGSAAGTFVSPFDLERVERNQAPRGTVVLRAARGEKRLNFPMPPDRWRIEVRPRFSGRDLVRYLGTGPDGEERGAAQESARQQLAEDLAIDGDIPLAAWLYRELASAAAEDGNLTNAQSLLGRALALTESAHWPAIRAWLWHAKGAYYRQANQFDEAKRCWAEALDHLKRAGATDLDLATVRHDRAEMALALGDVAGAGRDFERALAYRESTAPRGLDTARTRNGLALTALKRGDPATAAEHVEKSAAIFAELAPECLDSGDTQRILGIVALFRGDAALAQRQFEKALAIVTPWRHHGAIMVSVLVSLGTVAQKRGDLAEAEDHYRRALAIKEDRGKRDPRTASILGNLGTLAQVRKDLATAARYFEQAKAIQERLTPAGIELVGTLYNLGLVHIASQEPEPASTYLEQALAIIEKAAPGGLREALILIGLADLELARQNGSRAEPHLQRVLAIQEKLAPDSLFLADSLNDLGRAAMLQDDPETAARHHRAALAIRERLAPGSEKVADSLHHLAAIEAGRGDWQAAFDLELRAIDAAERQLRRLGGDQIAKASFTANYGPFYQAAIDACLALSQPGRAFELLERSRGQVMRRYLAEAHLALDWGLPAALAERRQENNRAFDEVYARLANAAPDAADVQALRDSLWALEQERAAIDREVRVQSPRWAALENPSPPSLEQMRRALGRGTLLLTFACRETETLLFALDANGTDVAVHRLPIGREAMRDRVTRFRAQIAQGRVNPGNLTELKVAAADLYATLLAPVTPQLARAERVCISPDGPLHLLPFAALARGGTGTTAHDLSWLIQWKAVFVCHPVSLLAVLQESKREATAPNRATLAVFGDPVYADDHPGAAAEFAARGSDAAGFTGPIFQPLPFARQEVSAIAKRFGKRATIYLGEAASEAVFKTEARHADYLHFACHGFLDEVSPLSSGLVLSASATRRDAAENGFLQAWELFQHVRVKADLVVLSACNTARGKDYACEGLLGMTRAFLFAGAHSVLASLWPVSDRHTADLMTAFYRGLHDGQTKTEAFRQAQLQLIEASLKSENGEPPLSGHPYFWSGFQLYGAPD